MDDYDYTVTKSEDECRWVGKTRRAMWQKGIGADYRLILIEDGKPTIETWINQRDKADGWCQYFMENGELACSPNPVPEHWHDPKLWAERKRGSQHAPESAS